MRLFPRSSTSSIICLLHIAVPYSSHCLQQFLAADLVPYYDQPGYLQTSDVTFSCSGEASNFLSLLDDLADNYPSIQLQNFSITTRSFAAADGTSSSGSIYNVTLRVVLCDKGGVQP